MMSYGFAQSSAKRDKLMLNRKGKFQKVSANNECNAHATGTLISLKKIVKQSSLNNFVL